MAAETKYGVSGLTKRYRENAALRDVDLSIPEGRLTVILGPSGCGKTTLLRVLAGLEKADAGRVVLDGRTVSDPGIRVPVERREIGMVFQDALLWPHLSVRGNIAFPLGLGRRGDPRVLEAARAARVEPLLDRGPGELSGGERRRVAIARAIVKEPRLFLLDEPLSGVDANLRVRLLSTIREVQRRFGLTTVYVTHDQEEALGLADHIVVMRGGEVLQTGSPDEIYQRPRTAFVACFVGLSTLVRGTVADGEGRTPLGNFPAAGLAEGAHLFAVRPEGLALSEDGGVSLVVEDSLFAGDRWLVTLGGLERGVLVWNSSSCPRGAEVRVRLTAPPVAVLEDEVSA